MVKFRLITVGKSPRDWREDAFRHYQKLILPYARLDETSVKEQKVAESSGVDSALARESEGILKLLSPSVYSFALDKSGKQRSSEELAEHFEDLFQGSSSFDLIIGGPHGLHNSVLESVNEQMSLSYLTLPHDLARIVVAEQLYRALSIINHSPYHK